MSDVAVVDVDPYRTPLRWCFAPGTWNRFPTTGTILRRICKLWSGQGRIEIFTKPGADELHGEVLFEFKHAVLNTRNPFVAVKPLYQRRQLEGDITGFLNKKTSFFLHFERRDINENAFVNAVTLTGPFARAVITPLTGVEMNLKIDRQLSKNHTLTARFGFQRDTRDNQGVGGFSLPSRAYSSKGAEDTFQLAETGVLNLHTVNETRFRFRRQNIDQSGGVPASTISVLDSFTDSGSRGTHLIRFGGLMRGVTLTNQEQRNYAGTFTFTSLDAYRLGLPNQFTLTAGDLLASLKQFDFGFYAQDDWRVESDLTLSGGLRYET